MTAAHGVPPSPARISRRFLLALGVVSLVALVIRVLIIVIVKPRVPALGDASAYHLLANHLADGRGYIRPFDLSRFGLVVPTAEYPPLHTFVLSGFARLGLRSVEAQRLALAVIGTASVAGIGWVGHRVANARVGVVAAALAACSPMIFLPETTLMSETIFLALVVGALGLAIRAREQGSYARFLALGGVLGLAALTRAEAGVLGVLLIVPAAFGSKDDATRRRIAMAATGLLAMVAVVVPWTLRNQATFHRFVPVSNNLGTAVAGANCALTYSGPSLGSWRSTFGAGDAGAGQCFTGFNGRERAVRDSLGEGHCASVESGEALPAPASPAPNVRRQDPETEPNRSAHSSRQRPRFRGCWRNRTKRWSVAWLRNVQGTTTATIASSPVHAIAIRRRVASSSIRTRRARGGRAKEHPTSARVRAARPRTPPRAGTGRRTPVPGRGWQDRGARPPHGRMVSAHQCGLGRNSVGSTRREGSSDTDAGVRHAMTDPTDPRPHSPCRSPPARASALRPAQAEAGESGEHEHVERWVLGGRHHQSESAQVERWM